MGENGLTDYIYYLIQICFIWKISVKMDIPKVIKKLTFNKTHTDTKIYQQINIILL